MARGLDTPKKTVELVKATYARTGNFLETQAVTGISDSTVQDIIARTDQHEEVRLASERDYIVKVWADILDLERILKDKIAATDIRQINLTDLTKAMKDLKYTISNVAEHVTMIQNNVNVRDRSREELIQDMKDVWTDLTEDERKSIQDV